MPLRLDISRWNSGLALLPPDSRVPARATEGADSGQASRKKAREGAGNTVPRPLMAARYRLRSRVKGAKLGVGCVPCSGLTAGCVVRWDSARRATLVLACQRRDG